MKINMLPVKIQSSNWIYSLQPKINKKNSNQYSNVSFCSQDVFQKINNSDLTYFSFVNKPGATTTKECKKVIKNHPEILHEAYGEVNAGYDNYKVFPNDMALTVNKIKKYLDKQYGKNGYRIISIGTSPSVIAKGLQITGAEVYYMPISGCQRIKGLFDNKSTDKKRNENITLNYIKSQGFSPKENDNKVNIVLDYVSTGATLKKVTKLIRKKFDIAPDKLISKSIMELIANSFGADYKNNEKLSEIYKSISCSLGLQDMAIYSNIPHFDIDDEYNIEHAGSEWIASFNSSEEEVFEKFKNFSRPLARAYELCLTNELLNN